MTHRLNSAPVRTPTAFCVETDKWIPKFIRKCKGSRLANTILKKKNKIDKLILVDFKTYYKATVIKTVWYWHKERHTD